MLRFLLEDRFRLKVHSETRLMPGYALVVDKRGPKLHLNAGAKRLIQNGKGSLIAREEGTTWLVGWLSQQLGRRVIDKTGLSAEFDFSLEWTPDPGASSMETRTPAAPPESEGPSLFTALKEQLGLRLIARGVPADLLIIDNVQRPSPN